MMRKSQITINQKRQNKIKQNKISQNSTKNNKNLFDKFDYFLSHISFICQFFVIIYLLEKTDTKVYALIKIAVDHK